MLLQRWMDARVKPGHDEMRWRRRFQTHVRVLAARCARSFAGNLALKAEGAGKTGCALHPRSRVRLCKTKLHTSIQVQRKHSGLPRAMALRLTSCSPRRTDFVVTVASGSFRKLDASVAASGPHDFTVRNGRARQSQPSRPSLPAPRL